MIARFDGGGNARASAAAGADGMRQPRKAKMRCCSVRFGRVINNAEVKKSYKTTSLTKTVGN